MINFSARSIRPRQLNANITRDSYVSGHLLHEAIADALERIISNNKDLTVVDAGCGKQPYRTLVQRLEAKYIGIDLEQSIGHYAPQDSLLIGPDGRWPLPDSIADIVLSTQVLEHVSNVNVYLNEAKRILIKDGWLMLSTHGNYKFHGSADYWRWTHKGLELLLLYHGFRVESIQPILTSEANLLFMLTNLVFPRLTRIRLIGPVFRFLTGITNLLTLSIDRTGKRKTDVFPCIFLVLSQR
jgi:SAM-dependent methyltransferase